MENTIAVCYLTHNHPDVVKQILPVVMDLYKSHGIDICIYDDSDDDKTKTIVEKFIEEGHDNLFYIDSHIAEGGDDKMVWVLKGYNLPKHYDYIWPSKDRCFFVGKTLETIVEACNSKKYDIVFATDENDRWELIIPKVKDEYTNSVEFFSHYGQLTTNWEAMIYRYDTMLAPIDWEEFQKRTLVGAKCNFNQTITVFTRLSEIDDPCIRVVHTIYGERKYSALAGSDWYSLVFDLWINRWVTAISSLPPIYDAHKLNIVKAETMLPVLFGGTDAFLSHKYCGALTRDVLEQYRSMWPLITDYPIKYVEMIVDGKEEELIQLLYDQYLYSFYQHDYVKTYELFNSNRTWLKELYEEKDFEILSICFVVFKNEMNQYGVTKLFEGINTPEELINRYKSLK